MDQQLEEVTVDIKKIAYKKSLLHSCKYATDDVLGVLIGTLDQKNVNIVDVYPLFHSRVTLNMLEVALDIINSELTSGQTIIGVYEARVNTRGTMSDIAQEILNTINSKLAVVMKITQIEKGDIPILKAQILSLNDNVKHIINQQSQLEWSNIENDLKQGKHWDIIDFDAHFENVKLDFRNKYLEQ